MESALPDTMHPIAVPSIYSTFLKKPFLFLHPRTLLLWTLPAREVTTRCATRPSLSLLFQIRIPLPRIVRIPWPWAPATSRMYSLLCLAAFTGDGKIRKQHKSEHNEQK